MLKRNGFELRRLRKTVPKKKIPQTDDIFKNVKDAHSKYNSIERCWGILEQHWNGTQLKTVLDAIKWASSMTWKSVAPIVEFIDKIYCKGITLTKQAFAQLNQVLHRGAGIDKWSVVIQPQPSNSPP